MRREEIKEARRTVIPGMSRSVSAITKRKTQMMLLPSFRELHATTQQKTEHTKHAKLHFLCALIKSKMGKEFGHPGLAFISSMHFLPVLRDIKKDPLPLLAGMQLLERYLPPKGEVNFVFVIFLFNGFRK